MSKENSFPPFLQTLFREPGGTASISRVLSALVVLAVLCWASFLVITTRTLPDLQPAGVFLTTSVLALYGVNKVTNSATQIFAKPGEKDSTE